MLKTGLRTDRKHLLPEADFRHPYLKNQLIAYIGNKRALLPFLHDIFKHLADRHPVKVFLDPFAGSGSVSRLAKVLGYRVHTNDWEFYTYVLNTCFLGVNRKELSFLFGDKGGLRSVMDDLNRLDRVHPRDQYIAAHYAPADTGKADYRRERLFYTHENALRIDAVRDRIEYWYPGFDLPPAEFKEKMVLLACLIYQCATHTNTSGVFKACHKGFGGHNADALGRILKPIKLLYPDLVNGRAAVYREDAAAFTRRIPADLCYLDPPYNIHQYGSNYHLLNTIAHWDKPVIDNSLNRTGRLKFKAAIRKDWKTTHSPFCSASTALKAFKELLDNIDSRFIALSYNTEGIIPFELLYDSLTAQGKVDLFTYDYVKYRGGRQSITRKIHNIELLLVLERGRQNTPQAKQKMESVLLDQKLKILLKQSFNPEKIKACFLARASGVLYFENWSFDMPHFYRFDTEPAFLNRCSNRLKKKFYGLLSDCACDNRQDELDILLTILKNPAAVSETFKIIKRLIWLLKKFTFKKYQDAFGFSVQKLKRFSETHPALYAQLKGRLAEVEGLAQKRFNG